MNILEIGNVSWNHVYLCPLNEHCPRIDCMSSYRLHVLVYAAILIPFINIPPCLLNTDYFSKIDLRVVIIACLEIFTLKIGNNS